MSSNNFNIHSISSKMLVQLSCEEFIALTKYAAGLATPGFGAVSPAKTHQVVGVTPLATELGCSSSFLYTLKAKGVLDGAMISHIGKKAVYDVDRARALAERYQAEQRASRQQK